jgi:outer membrane protein assembly factor BamA
MSKKSRFPEIAIFSILLCFSRTGSSAEIQPPFDVEGGGSYAQNKKEEEKDAEAEIAGVPALFNTPETGLALGGVLIYVPPNYGKKVSSILGGLVISQRKQIFAALFAEKYFFDDKWVGQLYAAMQDYPDLFFGTGRNTRFEDQETYIWNQRTTAMSLRYLFNKDLRFGLNMAISEDHFHDLAPDGFLDRGLLGVSGGRSFGLGGSLRWDSADDEYSPTQGEIVNIMFVDYKKSLGSDYSFRNLEVNAKKYWSLSKQEVIGVQIYQNANEGETPFYQLARLGGKNILRGYFLGRYRDQSMLVAQAEYRRHIVGRFGAVVFGGAGNVGANIPDIFKAKPKPAGGIGVRYKLVDRQKINVRIDIAVAPVSPSPSVYLYIMEAF